MKLMGYVLVLFLCGSLVDIQAQSTKGSQAKTDGTRNEKASTVVINHLSGDCSGQAKSNQAKFDPTYAMLANHPKTSLPASFTICSMAMAPKCPTKVNIQFFALLDEKGDNFIRYTILDNSVQ